MTWPVAATATAVMNHLLALACIALVLGLLRRRGGDAATNMLAIFLGVSLLVGLPVVNTMVHGQSNLIVLFLLCWVWLGLRRDRQRAAGAALALAILIKPSPAIFLLYLVTRRAWRALAACAVTLVAAAVATLALLPSGLWRAWLFEVRPTLGYGREPFHLFSPACASNQSLNALVSRLFLEPRCAPMDGAMPAGALVLTYVTSLAVLALTFYAVDRAHGGAAACQGRPAGDDGSATDLGFCLVLAAMFLTGSLSWEHHLVFAMPGLALLVLAALHQPRGGGELVGLALCVPGILVTLPLAHPALLHGWATALVSIRTWAVIVLWSMLWVRLLCHVGRREKVRAGYCV
jgi:alpha-1,2-mannosyltransferase